MPRAQFGSKNPNFGKHPSEETREKMRLAHLGSHNINYGKPLSEEHKAKIRATKIGKPLSKFHKEKLSESHLKGRIPTEKTGRKRAEKLFPCPKGMERHHIDGNPLNNVKENIMFVTRKQHVVFDGRIAKANKARLSKKIIGF